MTELSLKPQISIILPTYNESQNIIKILKSIYENLPNGFSTQTIVVDDNSPDGTGALVEEHIKNFKKITDYTIDIIHRKTKSGLGSAILNGMHPRTDLTIIDEWSLDAQYVNFPNDDQKDAYKEFGQYHQWHHYIYRLHDTNNSYDLPYRS